MEKNIKNNYVEYISEMGYEELSQESLALNSVIKTIKEVILSKILLEGDNSHNDILDKIEGNTQNIYLKTDEDKELDLTEVFREFDKSMRSLEDIEADEILEKYVEKVSNNTLDYQEIYDDLGKIRDYTKLGYLLNGIISLLQFSDEYSAIEFMEGLSDEIRNKKMFGEFSIDDLNITYEEFLEKREIIIREMRKKLN